MQKERLQDDFAGVIFFDYHILGHYILDIFYFASARVKSLHLLYLYDVAIYPMSAPTNFVL